MSCTKRTSVTALASLLAVGSLVGCASGPTKGTADLQAQAINTAPTCTGQDECARKMAAACLWLDEEDGIYPVEVCTQTEVRTAVMTGAFSQGFVANVTRFQIGEDTYRLDAKFGMQGFSHAPTYAPGFAKITLRFNEAINSQFPR